MLMFRGLLCPVSVKRDPHAAYRHRCIIALNEIIGMLTDNCNLLALVASCDDFGCKRSDVTAHLVIGYGDRFLVVGTYAVTVRNSALVAVANVLDHIADGRVLNLFVVGFNFFHKITFLFRRQNALSKQSSPPGSGDVGKCFINDKFARRKIYIMAQELAYAKT